jgi:hypothetical protein
MGMLDYSPVPTFLSVVGAPPDEDLALDIGASLPKVFKGSYSASKPKASITISTWSNCPCTGAILIKDLFELDMTSRRSASRPGPNCSKTRRVSPIGDTSYMKQEGKKLE